MKIVDAGFGGVQLVQLDPRQDDRGSFTRSFCRKTFVKAGLNTEWPQINISRTCQRGSVRGLHFQKSPEEEIKLVTCVTGVVFDVVVDVRPRSTTFGQWRSYTLSELNSISLYIPAGFAHGFQCLTDECRMSYLMSCDFDPTLATGVRHNDPSLAISWPLPVTCISPKDAVLPFIESTK